MALKRPPTHAADAEPRFIWADDEAWDQSKIKGATKNLAPGVKVKGTKHPVDAYLEGDTRYDLDAPMTYGGQAVTVRDFLNGKPPTVFHLRRVNGREWLRASGQLARDPQAAMWDLTRKGVVKIVEGIDADEEWEIDGVNELTEGDVQMLFEISAGLVQDIGLAVYRASKPLTEAEGKR